MIEITDSAARKIREMAAQHQVSHNGVRVMVVGGGCSGLTYDMDFENESRDGDVVVEHDGVKVFVDHKSAQYLAGVQVDYKNTLMESGFNITNPNASATCGCGQSFR